MPDETLDIALEGGRVGVLAGYCSQIALRSAGSRQIQPNQAAHPTQQPTSAPNPTTHQRTQPNNPAAHPTQQWGMLVPMAVPKHLQWGNSSSSWQKTRRWSLIKEASGHWAVRKWTDVGGPDAPIDGNQAWGPAQTGPKGQTILFFGNATTTKEPRDPKKSTSPPLETQFTRGCPMRASENRFTDPLFPQVEKISIPPVDFKAFYGPPPVCGQYLKKGE